MLLINFNTLPAIYRFCPDEVIKTLPCISKTLHEIAVCFLLTKDEDISTFEASRKFGLNFPTPFRVTELSETSLAHIINENFYTLLGLLPSHPMDVIGFHGTTKENMLNIFKTKQSGGRIGVRQHLCLASYENQPMEKVKFLADLYINVGKVLGYGDSILICKTPHGVCSDRPLGVGSSTDPSHQTLPSDDAIGRIFTMLITKRSLEGNVVEKALHLNPSNFADLILTSMTSSYPRNLIAHCTSRSFTLARVNKGKLMNRLRIQEVIFHYLASLEAITKLTSENGYELMKQFTLAQEKLDRKSLERDETDYSGPTPDI